MNENEIKIVLEKFHAEHVTSSPHDRPVRAMDGVTICSCGAEWRTWYTDRGLQWKPLNEQCASHDKAQAALPAGYGLDMEGKLFIE